MMHGGGQSGLNRGVHCVGKSELQTSQNSAGLRVPSAKWTPPMSQPHGTHAPCTEQQCPAWQHTPVQHFRAPASPQGSSDRGDQPNGSRSGSHHSHSFSWLTSNLAGVSSPIMQPQGPHSDSAVQHRPGSQQLPTQQTRSSSHAVSSSLGVQAVLLEFGSQNSQGLSGLSIPASTPLSPTMQSHS